MNSNSTKMLLSGNHAVAWGVKLAQPDVMPVYPITPQTPILEKLIEFHTQGDVKAEMITPESEHSAMSACITASLTGSRVFTATSSQGLLLMHELLHYAAGARAPIVMVNVNRTVASPWGFWPDHTDSLSQRDTGWVQFYSESPQESIDSVIQAFRIAETVGLPVMINHDAFYVSHAMEPVEVPSQALVNSFLPAYQASITLDPELGQSFGSPVDPATYNQTRRELHAAMQDVYGVTDEAITDWKDLTGRDYGIIEEYCTESADTIIVTLGSMAGTTREVIDNLRSQGQAIGMVKVRLFRPFPVFQLREALKNVSTVLVLDRNFSPGMGGILHQELKAALSGMHEMPRIHGLLAGVGGVNVIPNKIQELVAQYIDADPNINSLWVE